MTTSLKSASGNGREIPNVLSLSTGLTYFGLDISDTMVTDAAEFNARAVGEGHVRLVQGTSTNIPTEANKFDKALPLNTIYFWTDPVDDLKEIRRVLRSDGCLVIGALSPSSAVGRPVFQHGFRFYEQPQIKEMLALAGFASVSFDTIRQTVVPPTGQTWNVDYFIIRAA